MSVESFGLYMSTYNWEFRPYQANFKLLDTMSYGQGDSSVYGVMVKAFYYYVDGLQIATDVGMFLKYYGHTVSARCSATASCP